MRLYGRVPDASQIQVYLLPSLERAFHGQKDHSKPQNKPIHGTFLIDDKHLPWSDHLPALVVEKAIRDPAIGAERVIFGTDTPAPFGHYRYKGTAYPSYGKNPPDNYPDHYKYASKSSSN
jgi:hypothetical protein